MKENNSLNYCGCLLTESQNRWLSSELRTEDLLQNYMPICIASKNKTLDYVFHLIDVVWL